jgi:membrane fusion protein, multidrug efflux system
MDGMENNGRDSLGSMVDPPDRQISEGEAPVTTSRGLPSVGWLLFLMMCVLTISCRRASEAPARPAGGGVYLVDVITIQPRPFRETLSATGTLLARESVLLQAERAGIVRAILFEEGEAVRAGEELVLMDDSELIAQLARAEAQLEFASAVEARDRQLFQSGLMLSEAEYERTRANLDVARAEKKLIEAQLAKTRIVAPFDGVAGLRQVSVGTYLTPGTTICTFQDLSSLRLDFSLSERYSHYLRSGQKVAFRIAGQRETFEAVIAAIEPGIEVATRSLRVRAVAPNEQMRLLPGSFAEVEVVLDEVHDAILIPPIALIPGLQRQTVLLHRDGRVEERRVQVGLRMADAVQVVEGLEPGEELITTGILQLRPGMAVQVRRELNEAVTALNPTAEAQELTQ